MRKKMLGKVRKYRGDRGFSSNAVAQSPEGGGHSGPPDLIGLRFKRRFILICKEIRKLPIQFLTYSEILTVQPSDVKVPS